MDATLHAELTRRVDTSPLLDAARDEIRAVLGPRPDDGANDQQTGAAREVTWDRDLRADRQRDHG